MRFGVQRRGGDAGWTAGSARPMLLFAHETMEPDVGAAGVSGEGEFKVGGPLGA